MNKAAVNIPLCFLAYLNFSWLYLQMELLGSQNKCMFRANTVQVFFKVVEPVYTRTCTKVSPTPAPVGVFDFSLVYWSLIEIYNLIFCDKFQH